jgi:hypothetical protein
MVLGICYWAQRYQRRNYKDRGTSNRLSDLWLVGRIQHFCSLSDGSKRQTNQGGVKPFDITAALPASERSNKAARTRHRSALPRCPGPKAVATLEPGPTQHNSLETPDKEAYIKHINCLSVPTRMLSPNNGRLSGANKVGLFRADSLARYVLLSAYDFSVVAMDKTYLIEIVCCLYWTKETKITIAENCGIKLRN